MKQPPQVMAFLRVLETPADVSLGLLPGYSIMKLAFHYWL
jgi:hypothetical protein